jgi:hypothetical protein
MTPKEKAKELIDKFDLPTGLMSSEIKQCALITIDEILGYMGADRGYNFWQEVKTEIEKL